MLKLQAKLEVFLLLNLFKVVDPDQQAQRSYGLGQFILLLLESPSMDLIKLLVGLRVQVLSEGPELLVQIPPGLGGGIGEFLLLVILQSGLVEHVVHFAYYFFVLLS